MRLTRRHLLGGAVLLGAGAAGLSACGGGGEGGARPLRFAWWGNEERDRRTGAAVDAYTAATGRGVEIEPTNWGDYWDLLATQFAGGNPPDLLQMDYGFIVQYASRDSLLALDDWMPDPLDLSDFNADALDSGRVDGSLYGITMGVNSMSMMSNRRLLAEAGEDQPDHTITWSEFGALCRRIGANTPDGVYGTQNAMGQVVPFECWLRQRGRSEYTPEGQLGYGPDDLAEWFTYWMDLVDAGACPDAETTAENLGDLSDAEVPQGTAAFNFHWSNAYTAFSAVSADEVGISMYPQGDGPATRPGQYYKASMLLSVANAARDPDGAVDLLRALVFDPETARHLGFERGVPPSQAVREALQDEASQEERASLEYVEFVADRIGPVPPPPPQAAAEIGQEFTFYYEEAGFGRMSIRDAVDAYFDAATRILG